jgi:puromycin-sensitive aminopeptidase
MKNIRLANHIIPSRYKLILKPDLNKHVFEGEETIYLKLDKSVNEIVLHSKELKIFNVKFLISNFQFPFKSVKYNKTNETVILCFAKKLPKGKGELRLKFKGVLNDKMRGFYRSQYTHQGQTKHLATTQFEATDARRAFPCFDEPDKKAIFDISVILPKKLTAISNTVESEIREHNSEYKLVKFAPSPKMSTYLVAFIVGEFEFIEAKTQRGVVVRVFVTPGKQHQAKFALNTAVKVLDYYEKYFQINYPLPILDMIAIPDFSHGAMENWGAITYRESALLFDEEKSSASNKQWVALVIAHEIAHQWFGNLVTMKWWTDLWLNEGFASYIEYLAVDQIFPKWDIWTQFAFNDLGVALKLDALNNTHPIEVKVNHPNEIGEIFDEISYSKGASIIRMLAGYIGDDKFRQGLRLYLKKYAYANAETVNLWRAFEQVSGKPVQKIMKLWTSQSGYPLVKITQKPTGLEFTQARFYSSPISKRKSTDKTQWSIPITLQNLNTHQRVSFLLQGKYFLKLAKPELTPIKINYSETGFYRTDYPAGMLLNLSKAIQNKKLPPIDRLGLIRDAFAMSESAQLPTTQALNLAKKYQHETDYTVWVELSSGLQTLDNLLFGTKCYLAYKAFCQELYKNIVKHVGFVAVKNESHTQQLLRSLVLQMAGNAGNKAVISHAKNLFLKWQRNHIPVPANLKSVVYNLVAETGNLSDYNFLVKKYISEDLHEEKNRIGRALGLFKDPNIILKTLNFALSKHVRIQDTPSIFLSAWSNPYARKTVFHFTQKHWPSLLNRYPASGHMLSRFIKPMSVYKTAQELAQVKNFFKNHQAPGALRAVKQTLEKIHSNLLWLNRDIRTIEKYLSKPSN